MPASAQSEAETIQELVARTIDTCVGPRDFAGVGLEEALLLLASAPGKDCEKACKAAGKACLAVTKTEDKCGKVFLKGVGRVATAICQDSDCKRGTKSLVKTATASYIAQGDAVRSGCDQDAITCQQVCQP
jgi:hypothetical protein